MSNVALQYLGKYLVIQEIGQGRFSTVYKAEHPFLKKIVAAKLMRTDLFKSPEINQLFINEAQKASTVFHENLIPIHDMGEDQNHLYVIMDYLPGGNLHDWQKSQGQISFNQISHVISDCALALDHIHSLDMVHGDLKPGNILITEDGNAKIADFGILSAVDNSGSIGSEFSRATPQYLSPEQAEGGKPTKFSDQYSLGIIAYELFSGIPPFDGDTTLSIYLKHVRETPSLISRRNPLVTPQLEKVILRSLEKNPQNRFPDCRSFARALGEAIQLTETKKYRELLAQINIHLANYDLKTARPLIDSAVQIAPDKASIQDLITKLQKLESAQTSYMQAQASLTMARKTAQSIQSKKFIPADTEHLIPKLAPIPLPIARRLFKRIRPALIITLTFGIIGLLIGISSAAYAALTPSGTTEKATIVALARTSTPIPPSPTPTVTLTSTPTFTPTATVTRTPIPTFVIGSTETRKKDGMVMVFVPSGPFSMGSKLGQDDEVPVHTVDLKSFWMDQTEITNSMFEQCVNAGSCTPPSSLTSFTRINYYNNLEFSNYPVINVDWNQAKAYCTWVGGRLPSEAEWEKAARGTDARTYPWGEEVDLNYANFFGGSGDTEMVGKFSLGKSPYGAYDMAGNVWEWVNSQYKLYPYNAKDGREDLFTDAARVLRGGSFYYHSDLSRSSYRYWENPSVSNLDIGFRCALTNTR
ncbi:MAG: bifunctional serine/threonine-protein kinase/formylglycine-generating enzyme family protein [Chloroflexota bacterium]